MTEKLQLSNQDRQKFGGVLLSYKVLGTMNVCKTWVGLIHYSLQLKNFTLKEDQAAALKRHLEFFNTHPYVATQSWGLLLLLKKKKLTVLNIDDAAIQGVKIGMMGPLAGIGDPVFWFTVRPILGALGASFALEVVTSLVHFSSLRSLEPLSVWPSCGTLKNWVTRQVLRLQRHVRWYPSRHYQRSINSWYVHPAV